MFHALLLTAWIACQSLDASTTYVGLHSGHFQEANPFMKGRHLFILKGTINLGIAAGTKFVDQKTSSIMAGTMAVSGCLGGITNLHTMHNAKGTK